MKKSKFLLLVLILLLTSALFPLQALAVEPPVVSSPSVLLLDASSGDVLFEQNADERRHPASTTKIMTVLLTLEAIEAGQFTMDDSVVASDNCQYGMDEDSSNANPTIEPGEILSVRDLLYCAMHASANEACNILAEYVSGSISSFVIQMNQRAAELGCENTHFNNANGLEDPDHYSSARDLTLIAMEAIHYEEFITLCSDDDYTVPATNLAGERNMKNTNSLLNSSSKYYYEYAFGVKTGFFTNAGYCLVSAAAKENTTLVCTVLGGTQDDNGDSRFLDSIALYDWVFANYSYQPVLSSTENHINVPVSMGVDDSVAARPETTINELLPNDFDPETLEFEYVVYSERDGVPLDAPVDVGEILGEVTVSANGKVFGTSNLVASNSVDMSKTIYLKASINTILRQPIVNKLVVLLIVVLALYLILVFFYAVQRTRHRRSLRRARRDRAERQAMQETFRIPVEPQALPAETESREEEPAYEEDGEEESAGFAARLREGFGGFMARFRRPETDETDGEELFEEPVAEPDGEEPADGDEVYEDGDLAENEVCDEELPEEEPVRRGGLAGFFARFRRNRDADYEDDEYYDETGEEYDDDGDEVYDEEAFEEPDGGEEWPEEPGDEAGSAPEEE